MKIKKLIIALMVAIMAMAANAQEAFVPNSSGGLTQLTKALITGNKTGNSMLALYGKKITSSLVIEGKSSNTFIPKTSATIFVLTPKNIPVQAWKLVPVKVKKNNREIPFMKTSVYSGSKSDLDDIQLMTNRITDEIYELRPIGELKNGEYALLYLSNGVPTMVYDFRIESNLPPFPSVSQDVIIAELSPEQTYSEDSSDDLSSSIIRWYFDSDPRGARIFYRVISQVPKEVKNTNEAYLTTTPLEETKAINIPGLTYENSSDVVIEIKVTKRGFEEQMKRYNVRQVLDQQEISGFFELVEK